MGFDYLDDIFGSCRTENSKFSGIERRAVALLRGYADGKLDGAKFGEAMTLVSDEFYGLMKDKGGNIVFGEDTPLWLNLFLGNKFARWNKVRLAVNATRQRPDMLSDPRWKEVEETAVREDKAFKEAIDYCLKELRSN